MRKRGSTLVTVREPETHLALRTQLPPHRLPPVSHPAGRKVCLRGLQLGRGAGPRGLLREACHLQGLRAGPRPLLRLEPGLRGVRGPAASSRPQQVPGGRGMPACPPRLWGRRVRDRARLSCRDLVQQMSGDTSACPGKWLLAALLPGGRVS